MKSRIIAINKLGIRVIKSLPTSILKNVDVCHIQDQKNHSSLFLNENMPSIINISTNLKDLDQINYILDSLDLYIVVCEIENQNDYNFVSKILNSIKNKSEVILLTNKNDFLSYDLIKQITEITTTIMFVSDYSHSSYEFTANKTSDNRTFLIKNFVNSIVSLCRIIYETGDINIDFADLISVIKGSSISWFGHSKSNGADKSTEVINKLLDLQFYQEGIVNATSMIVQIVSGEEIKMTEVKELSDKIKSFVSIKCNIFFGLKRKKILHNEIELIVLASSNNDYMNNTLTDSNIFKQKHENISLNFKELHIPPFMRKNEKTTKTY